MTDIPNKAFIFAAGLGERLKPITNNIPKPLVEVGGKKLIEYSIEMANKFNIKDIAINSYYKKEKIREFIGKEYPEIIIFEEDERLETGGGLKNAWDYCGDKQVLCLNSDIIIPQIRDQEIAELINLAKQNKDGINMLLVRRQNCLGYKGDGDFYLNSDSKKLYKDNRQLEKNDLVFTGIQIINTTVLKRINKRIFSLSEIFKLLLKEQKIMATVIDGKMLHVGDIEGLELAENYLKQK
jgi:MurNAc alpha-1-phosphate uridylyltransferase